MKDYHDDRAKHADNQTKIFNNKVKVILFLLTVGTGVLTVWDKCSSLTHKMPADMQGLAEDSPGRSLKGLQRSETASITHKRYLKADSKPTTAEGHPGNQGNQSGRAADYPAERLTSRVITPVETVNADDIEFKLLSAEGSFRAQTIKMTMVLTNRAANRFIWSYVESISDPDGNVYLLKSFTNGASTLDPHVALDTDAPKKCTYTFGGILPSVKIIRLFKFQYRHKLLDDLSEVEFRNIPIDWK